MGRKSPEKYHKSPRGFSFYFRSEVSSLFGLSPPLVRTNVGECFFGKRYMSVSYAELFLDMDDSLPD